MAVKEQLVQLVPKELLVSAVQLERRAPLDNRVSRVLPAQPVFKEQQVCIIMPFRRSIGSDLIHMFKASHTTERCTEQ